MPCGRGLLSCTWIMFGSCIFKKLYQMLELLGSWGGMKVRAHGKIKDWRDLQG